MPYHLSTLYGLYMDLQHLISSYLKWKCLLGSFQSVINAAVSVCPPCCCSSSERTNERLATAFPLIVISLSQGELSRDRARTEQFSSPPIRAAAVFSEAKQLNWWKTTKETDGHTPSQSVGQTVWQTWEKVKSPRSPVSTLTLKLWFN